MNSTDTGIPQDELFNISFYVCVVIFSALHIILHKYLKVPYKIKLIEDKEAREIEFSRYVAIFVSMIHSFTECILCSYDIYTYGQITIAKRSSYLLYVAFNISFAYFLVDFVVSIIRKFGRGLMIFHHFVAVVTLLYLVIRKDFYDTFGFMMVIAESGALLLHIRKNVSQHKGYGLYVDILGIMLSVVYLTTRVGLGSLYSFEVFTSTMPVFPKIILSLIWFISFVWAYDVVFLLMKGISKKVDLAWLNNMRDKVGSVKQSKVKYFTMNFCFFLYCFPVCIWYSWGAKWF